MANSDAHLRLREWMSRSQLNQSELRRRLGISEAHISRLLSGERTPSLGLALRIDAMTGIHPSAWMVKRDDVEGVPV